MFLSFITITIKFISSNVERKKIDFASSTAPIRIVCFITSHYLRCELIIKRRTVIKTLKNFGIHRTSSTFKETRNKGNLTALLRSDHIVHVIFNELSIQPHFSYSYSVVKEARKQYPTPFPPFPQFYNVKTFKFKLENF